MFSSCTLQWPPRLVTVPGLSGSDGAHWQTWLERQFAQSLRVEQRDWNAPELHDWSASIDRLLARERGPFVLAAHSFGCLAAAQAIARAPHRLVGALLVAPAAPAHFGVAKALHRGPLGVPSIMVGSETDPWMPLAEATALARDWGASFINVGDAGHINVASGFGPWPRAKYWVDTLIHCAAPLRFAENQAVPAA
jgi:predicted alpha/beta hydrolase family esterase